ncbi:MAG TPA: hypothetical protein VFV72_05730 [Candidatus Limnocylindrales bacterium]|nr:hypothetical protein [Candidatus Limnocylindrales bacterium]
MSTGRPCSAAPRRRRGAGGRPWEAHRGEIHGFIARAVRDDEAAEDLVQETSFSGATLKPSSMRSVLDSAM